MSEGAYMPEEIVSQRGFCDWLIEAMTNCPCNSPNPQTVTCNFYTLIPVSVFQHRPHARARRSRRRRARVFHGRSSETSDSDGHAGKSGPWAAFVLPPAKGARVHHSSTHVRNFTSNTAHGPNFVLPASKSAHARISVALLLNPTHVSNLDFGAPPNFVSSGTKLLQRLSCG
jgi:hypothetical protein